jgi:putative hydrolase of the HAD superfamily
MIRLSSVVEKLAGSQPVVLFDMDDTLYPELDYMRSGVRHALSALEFHGSVSAFEAAMLRRFHAGQREMLMQDAFAEIGVRADDRLMTAFLSAYRDQQPAISLSTTMRSALDRLKSEGFAMALVTDGDAARQQRKVEALGLASWFDPIILTATLGKGIDKSTPLPFDILVRRFGTQRPFVFVADNPHKDFIHPLRLGWPSLRIRRDDGVYASISIDGVPEVRSETHMIEEIFRLVGLETESQSKAI